MSSKFRQLQALTSDVIIPFHRGKNGSQYLLLDFQIIDPGFGLPAVMDDHALLEITDHQLLLIGGDSGAKATGSVYQFDFDHTFVPDGNLLTARQDF